MPSLARRSDRAVLEPGQGPLRKMLNRPREADA